MHHFRGRLLDGDRICLDPANVYIQFHHAAAIGLTLGWHGYLLVDSDEGLEPGGLFTLSLTDGRSGTLRVDSLAPDDDGRRRAIFIGEGPLE